MTARAHLPAAALALAALVTTGGAQTAESLHGADAVFTGRGVVILWGVLRGPDEARSRVVIRVVTGNPALRAVAVEGVDPFTRARVARMPPSALRAVGELRILRAAFAEHPRTELHFASGVGDLAAGRPALTIYFTGVPDTAPEFPTEAALAAYLEGALARVGGR